jgi:hypothetical protein
MKKLFINILILSYFFSAMVILISDPKCPAWYGFIIYPLALLVAASADQCLAWVAKNS